MTICDQDGAKVVSSGAHEYELGAEVRLSQVPGTYEVSTSGSTITSAKLIADDKAQIGVCAAPGHDA